MQAIPENNAGLSGTWPQMYTFSGLSRTGTLWHVYTALVVIGIVATIGFVLSVAAFIRETPSITIPVQQTNAGTPATGMQSK